MSRTEELIRLAQHGDRTASEQLINENSGLIWSVARRFIGRGAETDDLYQLGCLGFLKAIEGFDPEFGTQFSTYAVPKISGEIRRFLRDDGTLKVSRSLKEQSASIKSARSKLTVLLGREPTIEEISKELAMPIEDVSQALDAVCAPVSLYDPVYSDGGDPLTVMDQVRDTKNTDERWMEHITLQSAFENLGPREKQILSLRFYDGKTQMEVAGFLGISQAQVSRLEKSAIGAMRNSVSVS